ncbi:MAG: FAD-binding oxidoreductase [Pseudomonadota bacterium]
MSDAPDAGIAVIGAGAVGIACALALIERGEKVTVFDPDPPASGASYGNAGVISTWSCVPQALPGLWRSVPRWLLDPEGPLRVRPSYLPRFVPWALRFLAAGRPEGLDRIGDAMFALSRPSLDLYRRNLEGTGQEHLVRDSLYVHVGKDRAALGLGGASWRMRKARGVPFHVVEGEEVRRIEPALAPSYTTAVVIEGQGRAMDPGAVGKALAKKAREKGARFHRRAVDRLQRHEGGWALGAGGESFQARLVVLAAGVWSLRLLETLGVRLPLEAERGYHCVLANPGVTLNNSIMDMTGKFVASSMAMGVRCAGTAEFAGIDAAPDMRRATVLARQAKRLFPDINIEEPDYWMGRRPSFPDSLPAIGPVPGQPGLIAAFGHAHYGFGMAPATGEIVAGMATGQPSNVDVAPYAVERFA